MPLYDGRPHTQKKGAKNAQKNLAAKGNGDQVLMKEN
jgi:hypothetical protein